MGKFKDFAKCAVANRFSLASYLLSGSAIISMIHPFFINEPLIAHEIDYSIIAPLGGCFLVLSTAKVVHTYRAYRNTKKHIKKYGVLDSRYGRKYSDYCDSVGVKLAAKESGLLNKLKK